MSETYTVPDNPADNATTSRDLPIPPGATAGDWLTDYRGEGARSLEWSKHDAAGIGVAVDGWQFVDGRVARCVSLYDTAGRELTADDARQLGAALLEAADVIDGWVAQ